MPRKSATLRRVGTPVASKLLISIVFVEVVRLNHRAAFTGLNTAGQQREVKMSDQSMAQLRNPQELGQHIPAVAHYTPIQFLSAGTAASTGTSSKVLTSSGVRNEESKYSAVKP